MESFPLWGAAPRVHLVAAGDGLFKGSCSMAAGIPTFTEHDKEVLVAIVKTAQQRKIKGKCGRWKEFLLFKTGDSMCDPAKQHWETLSQFVGTFTSETDIQMARRLKDLKDRSRQNRDTPEQALVNLTLENPRFGIEYNFPSYEKGWLRIENGDSKDGRSPERLLSLDCEMVDCVNDERNVVKVCIVDRNLETLLDTLVRPSEKVVDYLTHIHGIGAVDMETAACSQQEVQMKVKELLTPGTILVGHSLYHDLRALKIDYRRVIDTSMMFKHNGVHITFKLGLRNLCQAILGYDFRKDGKSHNCIDDAIVPMKIVLHQLQHGPSDPLHTKVLAGNGKRDRLFMYKIPQGILNEDMRRMFSIECKIERTRGKTSQGYAIFSSSALADQAYSELAGEIEKDSCGRDQKLVKLKPARLAPFVFEVCVKKQGSTEVPINDSPNDSCKRDQNDSHKRNREPVVHDDGSLGKKLKCSCSQADEVHRLQKLLDARDAEIIALKRLIVNMQQNSNVL